MKSRFPFTSFPSGWFFVGFSNELRVGDVKPIYYFGQNLVLFRTEDGTAHVFEAYCPHLGAHLGYGGRVKDGKIQCPFHGWCFNGRGECVDIPYANKIPSKARVSTFPVREVNDWILVYYSAQKESPTWEAPEMPEYVSPEWIPFKPIRRWKVRTHIRELAENGMDIAHLPFLHGQIIAGFKTEALEAKDAVHIHRVSTKYRLPDLVGILGKEVDGKLGNYFLWLGLPGKPCLGKSEVKMQISIMFLLTPIDEEYLDVNLVFSVKKIFNTPITKILAAIYSKEAVRSLEQDIPILENKAYIKNPLLCQNEGALAEYRHWANQFFFDKTTMTKVLVEQEL